MAKKRVNSTDPVRQVRLRVMLGNHHGLLSHQWPLAAGFVHFLTLTERKAMQKTHPLLFIVWSIGITLLIIAACIQLYGVIADPIFLLK